MNENFVKTWAEGAHGKQMYGDQPYVIHLEAVVDVLKSFNAAERFIVAGWLHDTVEDTQTAIQDVVHIFGMEVGMIVWACSGAGRNRWEKQDSIVEKLKRFPEAAIVKAADRIANVEHSVRSSNAGKFTMYYQERTKMGKVFELAVPWEMKERLEAAYYDGVVKGLLIE